MAGHKPINKEVVTGYLKRFQNTPTKTLAKKAYKENSALWPTFDACYQAFRNYRGTKGALARGSIKDRTFYQKPKGFDGDTFPRLPDTLDGADDWKNYEVDTPGPWGIISDIHIPFHNLPALRAALREGKRRGWKGILINGDLFDFPQFSRFDKDPRNKDFPKDLYRCRQFFDTLKDAFPKARKIFKFGNHDLHYSRYLWTKCPELLDVEATWLENLVECDKYGIEVVKNNEPVLLGKLAGVHGHEWGNGGSTSPVSPAKTISDRLGQSGFCGHWHKYSDHGKMLPISEHCVTTWSSGCLCGLHPEYARLNQWIHGAMTAEIYKDGSYEVDNFRIINGEKWS